MQKNKKYNVALIGAGRMGARWASIIAISKQASLRLVVDKDVALSEQVAKIHGAASGTNQRAAFGSDIDAVCIVTPHKFLYPLAKEALLAGKHVFVEKPGSRTESEMRDLIRIAREKRLTLTVGFNYRLFDSLRQAKKIVENGAIGAVHSVRIVHGHPGRVGYKKEWRMQKELAGGGVLMDQGPHVIDLARWFLEDTITQVSGVTSNAVWKAEVEDIAVLFLKTNKGKVASLQVSISEWKPVFSCHIGGEKGYLSIRGLGRKYGNGESFSVGIYNRKKEVLKEKILRCDPDADKALTLELGSFLDALANGVRKNESAEDAAEVLSIIGKVYAQAKELV